MNFTGWKYYTDPTTKQNIGITVVYEDGTQESRSLDDSEVRAWLDAGNQPLDADEL